jgi:hypothetical protein
MSRTERHLCRFELSISSFRASALPARLGLSPLRSFALCRRLAGVRGSVGNRRLDLSDAVA